MDHKEKNDDQRDGKHGDRFTTCSSKPLKTLDWSGPFKRKRTGNGPTISMPWQISKNSRRMVLIIVSAWESIALASAWKGIPFRSFGYSIGAKYIVFSLDDPPPKHESPVPGRPEFPIGGSRPRLLACSFVRTADNHDTPDDHMVSAHQRHPDHQGYLRFRQRKGRHP